MSIFFSQTKDIRSSRLVLLPYLSEVSDLSVKSFRLDVKTCLFKTQALKKLKQDCPFDK